LGAELEHLRAVPRAADRHPFAPARPAHAGRRHPPDPTWRDVADPCRFQPPPRLRPRSPTQFPALPEPRLEGRVRRPYRTLVAGHVALRAAGAPDRRPRPDLQHVERLLPRP